MKLELERPRSLANAAVVSISAAIFSGELRPGERLREIEISRSFGISRAPLREAFRTLATEGLVELKQNHGAFVATPSVEQIEQMTLARALIEGCAGRLVAHMRDRGSITRLETTIASLVEAKDKGDNALMLSVHWDFHRQICVESKNEYLLRSWSTASNIIRLYFSSVSIIDAVAHDILFMQILASESAQIAEVTIRSIIIRSAYLMINKGIPAAILPYVDYNE